MDEKLSRPGTQLAGKQRLSKAAAAAAHQGQQQNYNPDAAAKMNYMSMLLCWMEFEAEVRRRWCSGAIQSVTTPYRPRNPSPQEFAGHIPSRACRPGKKKVCACYLRDLVLSIECGSQGNG